MQIKEFIQNELLLPRLKSSLALVVYDQDRRNRELCMELATDKRIVIDAGESSIESREAALATLRKLGEQNSKLEWMLVYVPAKRPESDEQRQHDPFALYEACGAIFPDGDGDDYLNICLRAKPDYTTEIRRLFDENRSPSFTMVDAIGAGTNWPQLQATLKVDSPRDILMALLAPNDDQSVALREQEGWSQEARDLLRATLGLELKTKGKTLHPLSEELWRFLLFSEFVFDLPVELPASLSVVPRAQLVARATVDDLCDRLRSDLRTRSKYIQEAERVASELDLAEKCRGIEDLGEKDTFYFEERTFLRRAINGLKEDDPDITRHLLARHKKSVWLIKGESQAQWDLIRTALSLIEACDAGENQFPEHSRSQEALLDFYIGYLREVDSLQREFEQVVGVLHDPYELMGEVIGQAHAAYRRLAEKVQTAYVKHLETSGWPPAGRLSNAEVYDRFVGERLKDRGRKIALLMVDALRYELGVALEKLLAEDGSVELHAAYALLPTITRVGMASLLPGARSDLTLDLVNDKLVPKLGDAPVADVPQRMDALRRKLGDRFTEMTLYNFVKKGSIKLPATTELLVLRSDEIDSQLESNPESTLGLIPNTLKMIRAALHKLRGMAFDEAVIASDHGFFLNASAEAGDVCIKPQGKWVFNAHDRLLLGEGEADSHSAVIAAERLGIRGPFSRCAIPRSFAPYRDGRLYFHGGASPAEAVVPVLVMRLEAAAVDKQKFNVEMSYKHGAKKITTRLPVIEVIVYSDNMFDSDLEILLEAQDAKGDVVGEPRPGGEVNAATGTVTLKVNQQKPVQVVMRMHEEFRGKFTIKALNPKTLAAYSSLTLETDYIE